MRSNKIIQIIIKQQVKVRKYKVDIKKLQQKLRDQKRVLGYTNEILSKELKIPVTQVGHYFRTDKFFAIPDETVWPQLSKLLQIGDTELDKQIMTFEIKNGVFDKAERYYLTYGISPTILAEEDNKIIVKINEEKRRVCKNKTGN